MSAGTIEWVTPLKPPITNIAIKPKANKQKPFSTSTAISEYYIQLGAFSVKRNAYTLTKELKEKGLTADIQSRPGTKQKFTVFVGEFKDEISSRGMAKDLKRSGFSPKLESYGKNQFSFTLKQFTDIVSAKKFQDELSIKGFLSSVKKYGGKPETHIVRLGKYQTQTKAKKALSQIKSLGFKGFIKKIG